MEHFSARLTGPFLRFVGPASVGTPSIECSVRNSVFSLSENVPFVLSEAAIAPEDARRMVVWQGERNFFDDVAIFWSLEASDDLLSWEDWQELWQPDGNVGSKNLPIDWIVERPFENQIEVGEPNTSTFELGPGIAELNPAIEGATDGSDAGADLSELPLQAAEKLPVSETPVPSAETPAKSDTSTPEPAAAGNRATGTSPTGRTSSSLPE
jgi:hypothetical protein